ncbi:MAG: amidohydrolase [Desulfovibrio sp.]|nr:amidohydrolase [Desulfovibrio sp.]
MKIIAIEEHTVDAGMGAAVGGIVKEIVPYIGTFGQKDLPGAPKGDSLTNMDKGRIRDMDECGITLEILSYSNPSQWLLDENEAVSLCRSANDAMADLVKRHPGRFSAFASLPWVSPKAAADELRRTVKNHDFKGVLINGRPQVGAVFLDDATYDPVWEALTEVDLPIYIHPGFPVPEVQQAYYTGFNDNVTAILSTYGLGWHLEPGVQVLRMILSEVFDRFPALKVISGHWGEVLAYYIPRFDQTLTREMTGLKEKISTYYRRNVYVTPSGIYDYDNLQYCISKFGIDHIIFAADYPYLPENDARSFIEKAPLSEEEKKKIAHGNAERLFRITL